MKAYSTRVGNGPFPTEYTDGIGERLRTVGHEFGSTTGRPRRCGWLDMVSLKYSLEINGVQEIALTKLDVLDEFDEIKICTGYKKGTRTMKSFPSDLQTLEHVEPVYRSYQRMEGKNFGDNKVQATSETRPAVHRSNRKIVGSPGVDRFGRGTPRPDDPAIKYFNISHCNAINMLSLMNLSRSSPKSGNIKTALLVAAFVIIIPILFYTHNLVDRLQKKEREVAALYAKSRRVPCEQPLLREANIISFSTS